MAKRLYLFISFCFLLTPHVSSQSIKKAYRHYEKGEILKLEETLTKLDEKSVENSGKYFLYSLLYLEQKEDRNILKQAYDNILLGKEKYSGLDTKALEELTELGIDISSIDSLEDVIDSLEYQFVKAKNSIEEYRGYISGYPNSIYIGDANARWTSLEFNLTSNQDTWQAYKVFMDSFPKSNEFDKAKELYERLVFIDKTSDKSTESFERFISEYPDSPFRDSVEMSLLKKYTVDNTARGYLKFLSSYPESKYSELSINFLYHTSGRDYSIVKENVKDWDIVDSLGEVSSIDKMPLVSIYEEPMTHFINMNGEKIISTSSLIFSTDYMCSFTSDDFFVVEGENIKKIIGRDFSEIFSEDFSYVEDMGTGLIKVFSEDKLSVVHKSGKIILEGSYEDASVVNASYILLQKNEKYTLHTFMGERIFEDEFSDVYKEGEFIIFEREGDDKISVVNSVSIRNLFLAGSSLDFKYEDYEFFDENFMILVGDGEESLVDQALQDIVSMGKNKIERTDFGWVYKTEYGYKVITDLFSTDFSTYYESVSSNSKYVMLKNKGYWDVFSRDSLSFTLTGKDSVFALSDETLWYRDEFKESIYFSNQTEIDLPEDYSLKVMNPKYGSKVFFKVIDGEDTFITDDQGKILPPAEYFYTVQSGNTVSFLAKKFKISQSDLLRMNNKKNKNLFIGEKLKVKGYVPNDVVSDSLFLIEYEGKKGISNLRGEIVLDPTYDGLTNLDERNLILIKGEKFGNYSLPDGMIIEPMYSSIIRPFGEGLYRVNEDMGMSLINSSGETVLSPSDKVTYWNDTSAVVYRGGRSAIVTFETEEEIIEFDSYEFVDDSSEVIMIKSSDGFGLYTSKSGLILNPAYDQINRLDEGDFPVFKAVQFMKDARLLVNIIVDSDGEIIINQGLDIEMRDKVFCSQDQ